MKSITYKIIKIDRELGNGIDGIAYEEGEEIIISIDINAANKCDLKNKLLKKITSSNKVAIIQKNARY